MSVDNGDVLMLEASAEAHRPWAAASNAEVVDALPYIDDDYAHPAVKQEVDRLVEDEMRRSSKKPSDFLTDLPPVPKFNFQVPISSSQTLGFPNSTTLFLLFF